MAKTIDDQSLDAAHQDIINNGEKLVILSGVPADYSAANTNLDAGGNKLGEVALAGGDFTGPADGDTNGRKVTVGGKSGVSITDPSAGDLTWDHVAVLDDTNSRIKVLTELAAARTVQNGDSVDTDPFDYEIGDPT